MLSRAAVNELNAISRKVMAQQINLIASCIDTSDGKRFYIHPDIDGYSSRDFRDSLDYAATVLTVNQSKDMVRVMADMETQIMSLDSEVSVRAVSEDDEVISKSAVGPAEAAIAEMTKSVILHYWRYSILRVSIPEIEYKIETVECP